MNDRRRTRLGLRVIHRHRVVDKTFRRLSELLFVNGRPRALLGWIDMGGVRTPLCICELEASKLKKVSYDTYYYQGVTKDPRFES